MTTLILFANNAASLLTAPITAAATTATLTPGTGVLFPNPSAGQYFSLTFISAANNINREIVYVTAMSGDTIAAMTRAEEGTTAQAFTTGDIAQALITAGALNALVSTANGAAATPIPASYALSALPAASSYSGAAILFCSNGCNIGESSGFGTGCLVNVKSVSGTPTWCAIWSGIAVTS
jgi:hypothetical protein